MKLKGGSTGGRIRQACAVLLASIAVSQVPSRAQQPAYEGQPAVLLSSGTIEITVTKLGSTLASIVMSDDASKLNPLWNPSRIAREQGRQATWNGTGGHFVCVDGFGQPSADERAAGLPMHGEAHNLQFDVSTAVEADASSAVLTAKLPIVQENFTRTFRVVKGESVVYVDSQLENLMGFDRPVNWGEHATIMSPFLEPNVTSVYLSGTRSQNRNYFVDMGRGAPGGNVRRLAPGLDFTWPLAPGLDGKPVDLSPAPQDAHFTDHATTLLDPAHSLAWVAALNTTRRMVYGYIFKREEYPWVQHWNSFSGDTTLVRGMEFATQPYDVSHRTTVELHSMFGAPVYRWLPAKSRIDTHFLLYYARVPEGLNRVDDVRLENGKITIEDRTSKKQMVLAASRGLQ